MVAIKRETKQLGIDYRKVVIHSIFAAMIIAIMCGKQQESTISRDTVASISYNT